MAAGEEQSRRLDAAIVYEGYIIRLFARPESLVVRIYPDGSEALVEELVFPGLPHDHEAAIEKAMIFVESLPRSSPSA